MLLKILDSNYEKAYLDQVDANTTHMDDENRTQLQRLLKYFGDLFDGNLGDWDTEPVDLESNPDYKLFNCKYYPVPRINKEAFNK